MGGVEELPQQGFDVVGGLGLGRASSSVGALPS